MTVESPFVLDRVENPHPVMLTKALQFRRAATADPNAVGLYWLGYRDAMCDATGESSEAIEAWMDRHDDVDIQAIRETQETEVTIGPRR